MLKLYTRLRLPDGREGLLLCSVCRGPGDPEQMGILTDDYVRVICRPDQVKMIKRYGETVPLSNNPGGDKTKVYPVERDNINLLREAVWHEHYQKFGEASYGRYQDSWKRGDVKLLPKKEDIRESREAFTQQFSLFRK